MVLLGFIDQPVSDPSAVSWDTNKIGGSPVSISASLHTVMCCIGTACICLLFASRFLFVNLLVKFNWLHFFVNKLFQVVRKVCSVSIYQTWRLNLVLKLSSNISGCLLHQHYWFQYFRLRFFMNFIFFSEI